MNPFRAVGNLVPERIDQGVDYAGNGRVFAIGRGRVVYVNTTGQWFPPAPDYIAYRLTSGRAAGLTVYIAECIHPWVRQGELVGPHTVVGKMFGCGYGIETGWAAARPMLPDTWALAAGCWNSSDDQNSNPTGFGVNFSELLQSLGAAGGIEENPPVCANLPLPSW